LELFPAIRYIFFVFTGFALRFQRWRKTKKDAATIAAMGFSYQLKHCHQIAVRKNSPFKKRRR
jgi:hypothetical protein